MQVTKKSTISLPFIPSFSQGECISEDKVHIGHICGCSSHFATLSAEMWIRFDYGSTQFNWIPDFGERVAIIVTVMIYLRKIKKNTVFGACFRKRNVVLKFVSFVHRFLIFHRPPIIDFITFSQSFIHPDYFTSNILLRKRWKGLSTQTFREKNSDLNYKPKL